jgi:hypothetical protein
MVDFQGNQQLHRVFLGCWIADKEEQNRIACLGSKSCTVCEAETHDLSSAEPCPIRTGKGILQKIRSVCTRNPNFDTWKFISEYIKVQLSGVEKPCWANLPYTDICRVICNDTLHDLHKAFKDHTAL